MSTNFHNSILSRCIELDVAIRHKLQLAKEQYKLRLIKLVLAEFEMRHYKFVQFFFIICCCLCFVAAINTPVNVEVLHSLKQEMKKNTYKSHTAMQKDKTEQN